MQIRPGKLSGAVLIYRDLVLPLLQGQRGLCEARLLTDGGTGRGLLVTLWTSAAAMRAAEAQGVLHEEIARLGPVLGVPPSRECYEVSMSAGGSRGGKQAPATERGKAVLTGEGSRSAKARSAP